MKKTFTIGLFLLFTTVTFCQNQFFEFTHLETSVWGDANSQLVARAYIKNITDDTMEVKVRRYNVDVVAGSQNSFCWDLCYDQFTSISVHSLTMEPDSVKENFYADFLPQGNVGISTLKYCFYDEVNTGDSICVMAYFNASPTGIESSIYTNVNTLSSAYPNPAAGTTKINYTLRNDIGAAKIDMHNMLGAKVKSIELKEKFAAVEIPLSGMESGVYFYSLIVDEKTVATKKLVVTK